MAIFSERLAVSRPFSKSASEDEPVARRQVERFEDLRRRLDGYAHNSSHDRIQLMTDEERTAADEARIGVLVKRAVS